MLSDKVVTIDEVHLCTPNRQAYTGSVDRVSRRLGASWCPEGAVACGFTLAGELLAVMLLDDGIWGVGRLVAPWSPEVSMLSFSETPSSVAASSASCVCRLGRRIPQHPRQE